MNQSKKGFIYTTIGATLWGINGAFAEFLFLQKGVTSDWLTPYRLLLAGVFLLVYLYAKDKNKIFDIFRNTKDLIRVFVFGVFGMQVLLRCFSISGLHLFCFMFVLKKKENRSPMRWSFCFYLFWVCLFWLRMEI